MSIRDNHPQAVDIVRHTERPRESSVAESVPGSSLCSTIVIGTMTDLVCPDDLIVHGRNALVGVSVAEWMVFVDDSTAFEPSWFDQLGEDLDLLGRDFEVACSVGSTSVPLVDARLDVAYRRSALEFTGGFANPVGWPVDDEMQSRLVLAGYAVRTGRRMMRTAGAQ